MRRRRGGWRRWKTAREDAMAGAAMDGGEVDGGVGGAGVLGDGGYFGPDD
jgi:hypothetical protein